MAGRLKLVHPKIKEIMECDNCCGEVEFCGRCSDFLVVNEPIYCGGYEHYCEGCYNDLKKTGGKDE